MSYNPVQNVSCDMNCRARILAFDIGWLLFDYPGNCRSISVECCLILVDYRLEPSESRPISNISVLTTCKLVASHPSCELHFCWISRTWNLKRIVVNWLVSRDSVPFRCIWIKLSRTIFTSNPHRTSLFLMCSSLTDTISNVRLLLSPHSTNQQWTFH